MSVYVWGLMPFIKKGNDVTRYLVPKRVKFPKKFNPIKCASSNHCFFILTDSGNVFSWGEGKSGRLGHGNNECLKIPKMIESLSSISNIFSANGTTIAIAEDGGMWMWGFLNKKDSPVRLDFEGNIKKVAIGLGFALFLDVEGQVFSMGSMNSRYQCGTKNNSVDSPKRILKDRIAIDIGCGAVTGYAVLDNNAICVWGDNKFGQLGIGKKDGLKRLPRLLKLRSEEVGKEICGSLSDKYCHAGLLLDNGKTLWWGSNYKGKLATGNTDDQYSFHLCEYLENVQKICCGGIHNLALSEEGKIYSFGCGSDGRLGHPECEGHRYLYKEYIPRVIDGIKTKVMDLACSYYAGICICEE